MKGTITAKEIVAFMNYHGLSVKELSEILGVTGQAIRYWKSGERVTTITISRLIRLFIKYPQLLREF